MATQRRSASSSSTSAMPPGVTDSAQPSRRRKAQPATSPERAEISNEARYMMIQQAAYLRAERRGFEPGFELDDWFAAENEVDTLLGASHDNNSAQ